MQTFSPSPAISTEIQNYSGQNGTGTLTIAIYDWTGEGSQMQTFITLSTGDSVTFVNYAGSNGTGLVLTDQ